MTLEDKCVWKTSTDGSLTEGRMKHCKKDCDGYNFDCEYYISDRILDNGHIKPPYVREFKDEKEVK